MLLHCIVPNVLDPYKGELCVCANFISFKLLTKPLLQLVTFIKIALVVSGPIYVPWELNPKAVFS